MLPPHDQSIMFEKLHESGGNSMLPLVTVSPCLFEVLQACRGAFGAPGFAAFVALVVNQCHYHYWLQNSIRFRRFRGPPAIPGIKSPVTSA
jgi:hypothetical protein